MTTPIKDDLVERLLADIPEHKVEGYWTTDYDALEQQRAEAATELTTLREQNKVMREALDWYREIARTALSSTKG